jgi:riboflavin synthase
MFTGIITDVGHVQTIRDDGGRQFKIETFYDAGTIELGASICCSGACMTVTDKGKNETNDRFWFSIDVSFESLAKTTLGDWQVGTSVNLERSLSMGDELGGHIVTGHVDGVGVVETVEFDGMSTRIRFQPPTDLLPFIAKKGSVTVDGVSLTVNEVDQTSFEVNLIPHTLEVTNLNILQVGSNVNIEIDPLARYVARQLEFRSV